MDIKEYKKLLPRPVYEVQEVLQKAGYRMRIVKKMIKGKAIQYIGTRDYKQNRVNVTLKDEMVIDFYIG